jgi:hypothetical protein
MGAPERGGDDGPAALLRAQMVDLGVSDAVAGRLAARYPAPYLAAKIAQVAGLIAVGSSLVSRNPAGYLRRAIEEDYAPVGDAGRRRAERDHPADARGIAATRRPAEATGDQPPPYIGGVAPGPDRVGDRRRTGEAPSPEVQAAWGRAKEQVRGEIKRLSFDRFVREAALVSVASDVVTVGAVDAAALQFLRTQVRSRLEGALIAALGRQVRLEFALVERVGVLGGTGART